MWTIFVKFIEGRNTLETLYKKYIVESLTGKEHSTREDRNILKWDTYVNDRK